MPAPDALLSRLFSPLFRALPGLFDGARGVLESVYWSGFREGLMLGLLLAAAAAFLYLFSRSAPDMSTRIAAALLAALAAWLHLSLPQAPAPDTPQPLSPVSPVSPAPPSPRRPLLPWRAEAGGAHAPFDALVRGPVSPSGEPLQCLLPPELHRRNTASRGLGLCVFTSIHHAAELQNVPQLLEFPKWVISKGIPGGGYPDKVADLVARMCRDRGVEAPDYLQVEGDDVELLRAACASGRMPGVTYSFSPTGRYRGQRIAHMVNLAHAKGDEFAVLDNNYPGSAGHDDVYEWLDSVELLKTWAPVDSRTRKRSGWAVVLLGPAAPPAPKEAP